MHCLRRAFVVGFLAACVVPAAADEFAPAVVFDVGGRFDAAFNELVHQGVERFAAETGLPYAEAEPADASEREAALRAFAAEGRSPILAVGYAQAPVVAELAATHPETEFTIVDAVVDLPNVRSVVFDEHEGSFLVGMVAAMASRSGTIGFVGGMDIPVIRAFGCGYRQGARHVDPDAVVLEAMAGDDDTAWSNPLLGAELARQQVDQGADVVFHAAGGSGLGVLQAMAEEGLLGIGVDSNQNGLFPGHVLTSMVKRVDVAAHAAFSDALDGTWQPGIMRLGLAEGGVGWALDENNATLVTPQMFATVEQAQVEIIAGRLVVHDWRTDGACPD